MIMAKAAAQKAPAIDTALLAKLTGGFSDPKTIAKIGSSASATSCAPASTHRVALRRQSIRLLTPTEKAPSRK